ncbi:right-handed parallel beta-helix repeat-containing protein [Microbacterium sp.]|uniref:right-handed parallel beta-helix repeat-containing protein n=1 Tax=Microbacterium sp. TaxID=51671 RepID=UPI003A930160
MNKSVSWGLRAVTGIAAAATVGALGVMGAGAASADTLCQTAGDSGFTAAVVAHPGQKITNKTVDATGCDVGIYVDVPNVTINGVTVTGANAAGILAEATSHLTITRSTVDGNGFNAPAAPYPPGTPPVAGQLDQAFAISLFGVSHATVSRNTVYNNGRGGIGVMDNGPFDPGRVVGLPTYDHNFSVTDVTVERNTLWANYNGCAIVTSAFNEGNTVSNIAITRNVIKGTGFVGGADVGGIVAQSNGPDSVVSNIDISRNTVTNSVEGGVIVHAAAPGSSTRNVSVTRNVLSGNGLGNGSGDRPDSTVGVVVDSLLAGPLGQANINTVVSRNTISNQFYGIWTQGPDAPTVSRNDITVTAGGTPIYGMN